MNQSLDASPEDVRKLYVVGRRDLPPGLRAAQISHAVAEACLAFPEAAWEWNATDNFLIVLEAESESVLAWYYLLIAQNVQEIIPFREPDLDGALTAFAALPAPDLNHLFASLPLAYSPPKRWWRH